LDDKLIIVYVARIPAEIVSSIDMSESPNSDLPVSATVRPPKTWDFMETTFVVLIAYAVFGLTAGLAVTVILLLHYGVAELSPAQYQALAMNGHWYGVALMIAFLPTLAVLWVAIRKAGRDFTEYLALNWPSRNELLLAFAVTAAFIIVESAFFSSAPTVDSPYIVGGAGGLFVFLVGGCLAGPIMEELVFRGFMFRGWSKSFLGPIGAIVLTSALFGMYHTQYDWPERFWIFLSGLVLCTFRWRTNSTSLAVVIHSAMNTYAFFLSRYV
jgi:CAAX protease family protein